MVKHCVSKASRETAGLALCAQACIGLDAASAVEILQSDFVVVTIVFLKKTIVLKYIIYL